MQIVRTIVWVLLLVALLLFTAFNWRPVEVKIWEGLILETKIPALVVISFLLGLVPMWMLHKTQTFHYNRRISSLESAARTAATTPVVSSAVPAPADEAAVAGTPVDPAPDARPVPESEKPRDNLSPEER
jgi:lipopolysaccharide assembly protein A